MTEDARQPAPECAENGNGRLESQDCDAQCGSRHSRSPRRSPRINGRECSHTPWASVRPSRPSIRENRRRHRLATSRPLGNTRSGQCSKNLRPDVPTRFREFDFRDENLGRPVSGQSAIVFQAVRQTAKATFSAPTLFDRHGFLAASLPVASAATSFLKSSRPRSDARSASCFNVAAFLKPASVCQKRIASRLLNHPLGIGSLDPSSCAD
jgi:hypothetical protein